MPLPSKQLIGGSSPSVPVILRVMLNKETENAFYRIEDALKGETDDDLYTLMNVLGMLYERSRDIYNTRAGIVDGSEYNFPSRY